LKLLVALFVLMIAIAAAGFFVWRSSPEAKPCSARVVQQQLSPDGATLAESLEVQCEKSLTTHVTLRAAKAPDAARSDVWVAAGAQPVELKWAGQRELQIAAKVRALVSETSWRNVSVVQR
jgi:hypothetical protein